VGSSEAASQAAPESADEATARTQIGIGQYLATVLGLVPVAIAILRVVFEAHGDTATLYVLVQTLDIPTLFIGTYGRYVGVLGLGVTVPLLFYSREKSSGSFSIALGPFARLILWVLLACSAGCLYPEQIADITDRSVDPTDLRVLAYPWLLCGLAWYWDALRAGRSPVKTCLTSPARFGRFLLFLPGIAVSLPVTLLAWLAQKAHVRVPGLSVPRWTARPITWVARHWVDIFVLSPALIMLLWSYLLANDRMWLPAQAVTVRPTADITLEMPATRAPSSEPSDSHAVRTADGDLAFVAYILSQDSGQVTLLTTGGRILQVPAAHLTDHLICQWEPDYDPGYDTPMLIWLQRLGHVPREVDPTCAYWLNRLAKRTVPSAHD